MVALGASAALDHAQPCLRAIRGCSELPRLRAALAASVAAAGEISEKLAA